MPSTAGATVTDDADAPVRPGWFVGVITTTIRGTSDVERFGGLGNVGRVPTAGLVVKVV